MSLGTGGAVLRGTYYEWMYTLFGSPSDIELINRMTLIGFIYTVGTTIWSLIQPAPYGRYANSLVGPTMNTKLAWTLQESPAWILPILLMISTPCQQLKHPANLIAVFLIMTHYIQRSLIYPQRVTSAAKPTPILIMVSAFLFCCFNGFYQGHHLINIHSTGPESAIIILSGLGLFVVGMFINIKHDGILVSLKRKSAANSKSKSGGYQIPRGGLFEYVSGANFLGEIIEWWSLYLITAGTPQLLFALFSTCFLGLRAHHHHQFYKKTFGSAYPPERKILIPFIL